MTAGAYSAGGSFAGDTLTSGISFASALALNGGKAITVTGNNWANPTGTTMVFSGDTTDVVITGNNIPGSAGNCAVFATLNNTGKIVIVGNNTAGYTTMFNIDAAHSSVGTNQIVASNTNNTTGTH
jgi:hypothetical protein